MMKKFTLPIILLLTVAFFFLSSKADAQTGQDCSKTRARASYNCLTERTKCLYSCVDKTKDVKACDDTCGQSNDACEKQVDADYGVCLGAIKKDKKDASSEIELEQDCRKIFDKESYKCLGVSGDCQRKCSEETKRPDGGTYFNSGEIYSKCTKASDCDGKGRACNEQALANFRACQDPGKQPVASEVKRENPKQDGVPVFVGEWFSRFSQAIDGLTALPGVFTDVVYEDRFYLAGDFPKLSEMNLEDFYQGSWYPSDNNSDRLPNITVKDEQKAWDISFDAPPTEKVNVTVLQGEAQIKSPDSPQFIPIGPKGGDTQQVTFFDSTVRSTSDSVQLRHAWSADSGTVINVPKWSEIKFREPVEAAEGITSHTVELEQGEIEVKVRNNKPAENQFGVDAGWLGVTVSRTHFWVSQSQDKKLAVIGVYEGEVEVKTKDGKTIKVKPDGNKPGVAVVSQKLSIVKLVIAGLVLIAFIGGAVFILRKRFSLKSFKKRK